MGLRGKVLAAPVVVLVLFAVVGVTAVFGFRDVREQMGLVTGELAPDTALANKILTTLYRQRLRLDAFVNSRDPALAEEFTRFGGSVQKALDAAAERISDPQRQQMLVKLEKLTDRYEAVFKEEVKPAASRIDDLIGGLSGDGEKAADTLDKLADRGSGSNNYALAFQAQRANGQTNALRAAVRGYLSSHDPKDLKKAERMARRVKSKLQILGAYALGDDRNSKLLDTAGNALDGYMGTVDKLSAQLDRMEQASHQTMGPIGREMASVARDLQDNAFGALDTVAQAANARTSSAMSLTVGLMAAAIVGGLVLALLITRTVMRPVLRARGEITELLEDMNAGRADLSKRLTVGSGDEVGAFIASVNRFLEALNDVVRGIGQETESLATASEELTAVTDSTEEGIERQRRDIEQAATAMNEMVATAQEIARNTAEAARTAEAVSGDSGEGGRVVQQAVDAMDTLSTDVESASAKVLELQEQANAIGRVLEVIGEVAEQTNLLALNAAIEAARAGEAGRGFAVVADEVRTLAQRTQQSTGEIGEIIERLRRGAEDAAGAMEQTRSRAQETVQAAAQAGDSLNRIGEGVGRMSDMNSQIASAAEEQTATGENINESVTRVNDVVEESVAAVGQISRASNELAAMSERLRSLVRRFQAGETG
jgi:methyl-accepting chemotaxis protein